jgi:hypothetical protein
VILVSTTTDSAAMDITIMSSRLKIMIKAPKPCWAVLSSHD